MKVSKVFQKVVIACWIVACCAWTSAAEASEVHPAETLATTLVEAAEFREVLANMLGSQLPAGHLRDLAMAHFVEDELFWDILGSEMAVALEREMDEDALTQLQAQYDQDAAKAWDASHEIIGGIFQQLSSEDGTKVGRHMLRFGCQLGYTARPSFAVVEQADLNGQPAMENPQLKARLLGMMEAAGSMCDCLQEGVVEKLGEKLASDPSKAAEREAIVEKLVTSGACPDPFREKAEFGGTSN